jgi:bifunctional non-homologous end joining protein LigD
MTRRQHHREVSLSNLDKVFFPKDRLTKWDIVDYYERVSEHILPHLEERPLVVQRFPDGIGEDGFYQKQAGEHFPDWVRTAEVELVGSDDRQDLVVCDDVATLVAGEYHRKRAKSRRCAPTNGRRRRHTSGMSRAFA